MIATAPDISYCTRVLLELLGTPSPSGYTDKAVKVVERHLQELGIQPVRTPKGALIWTLEGKRDQARAVASHIDTLGAMVKEIKENGRLKLTQVGSYDWTSIEGAECKVHLFDGRTLTGTVVNTKQSTHVHGPELQNLKRNESVIEVRLDAETDDAVTTTGLGVGVGNFVSFDSQAQLTEQGFVKGRHLDNKAAVAISLAVTKTLISSGEAPATDLHFFISNYEEVGHGAAAGIPDITELLCLDMAAIGDGQSSNEYSVTLCVKDSSGPYDYDMNQSLLSLARTHNVDIKTDIYPYYGSDASAAWRAGGNFRAALIGPGVDASHAYERTHVKALEETSKLLLAYALNNPNPNS